VIKTNLKNQDFGGGDNPKFGGDGTEYFKIHFFGDSIIQEVMVTLIAFLLS
jgi:hypothetical protein